MSLLAPSGYLHVEDQIDAIGQKYRVQRIIRGAIIWIVAMASASFLAALAAHHLGQGVWTAIILTGWCAWAVFCTWRWFARPMLIRPDSLEVARYIESRVGGLHNALTNSLLLHRRKDLEQSPWLPVIYDELATTASSQPIGKAVRLKDVVPLAWRAAAVVIPLFFVTLFFPNVFYQGWKQLTTPTAFVPRIGAAEILDVQPKDVTLVIGQPLEISATARCPGNPTAQLIFGKVDASEAGALPQTATIVGAPVVEAGKAATNSQNELQYSMRLDHVDRSMRYRVEVAGTQSPWYSVTVVNEVKLLAINIESVPPTYTAQKSQSFAFKAEELAKANIVVPQGSKVTLSASLDVPVSGALLETAGQSLAMDVSEGGRRVTTTVPVLDELPIAILIMQGGKQIVSRLPREPLTIHCIKDQPPVIEMKWPTQDLAIAPDAKPIVRAFLRDDYTVSHARVLMAVDDAPSADKTAESKPAADLAVVYESPFPFGTGVAQPKEIAFELPLKLEQRKHGNVIRLQVEATDNRDLSGAVPKGAVEAVGPQTSRSVVLSLRFEDPAEIAREQKEQSDKLRERLAEMLRIQRELLQQTLAARITQVEPFAAIGKGQADLRLQMRTTAESFQFAPDEAIVRKVLLKLAFEEASEAVALAGSVHDEPAPETRKKPHVKLQTTQRHIIDALETLLARLNLGGATTQPSGKEGNDPLLSRADALKKLDEALKEYMKQERKILDQTTSLAKKPVDDWDQADKKLLDDLKMAQEKLDSFMQEKLHDFSKNSEQDMANASLLKQLMEVTSETTMAKDALKQKAAEIAVAAEENGIDNAKELTSNIEKWLSNTPDRTKWTQEDLTSKTDLHMPELPKELEDIVGKLMEQEEDLFEQIEDANANLAGSFDKGIGWDAADGPIASMNAQGVTGNQLPNNNEMNGRSGEGRSGKSQGEFVEDHATGKGGRNTPTRLDPTPFQKGQVKDTSKDPTGGATGGGKVSGQGGEGLEGPVPPKLKQQMERLAQKQAQLRNAAERLNLQYKINKFDNFSLDEAITMMRRVESDLHANRYNNALRKRDATLSALDTSRLMVAGETHVQRDTTPAPGQKSKDKINDAMKGQLPAAWSEALKEYYRKLGQQ